MTATPEPPGPTVSYTGAPPAPTTGPAESAGSRYRHWLRLAAGVLAIALAAAAFAWPEATVQVLAVLFGLHLAVSGFVRAGLSLFPSGSSLFGRLLGVVFGVLTALLGILCLRNLTGSLTLLVVVVAVGWLLDGLAQLMLAIGGPAEDRGGARFATGLFTVLGAIVLLVWPKVGLGAFIFIGATVLAFAGIGAVFSAIAGLRARRS